MARLAKHDLAMLVKPFLVAAVLLLLRCHAVASEDYKPLLNEAKFFRQAKVEGITIHDATDLHPMGNTPQFIDNVFAWLIVTHGPFRKMPVSGLRVILQAKPAVIGDLLLDAPKWNVVAFDHRKNPLFVLECHADGVVGVYKVRAIFHSSQIFGKPIYQVTDSHVPILKTAASAELLDRLFAETSKGPDSKTGKPILHER